MPKTKISVTVEESLIRECDRQARGASRSEVVGRALSGWLRDRRRRTLEEETEKYYRSLSDEERREDASWADQAGSSLGEAWK